MRIRTFHTRDPSPDIPPGQIPPNIASEKPADTSPDFPRENPGTISACCQLSVTVWGNCL